jgi:hypothetical protein
MLCLVVALAYSMLMGDDTIFFFEETEEYAKKN